MCNTFDLVVHAGQLWPIGRRVLTSMRNLISNFAMSMVVSVDPFAVLRGHNSRIPLRRAPVESSGGPNATKGGLSIRILRVKGSVTDEGIRGSVFGEPEGFLAGFCFSFEPRRWIFLGQSMTSINPVILVFIFLSHQDKNIKTSEEGSRVPF